MPVIKHYLKDFVIRFNKNHLDAVARCFFYSVLTLRCWRPVKLDHENAASTDVWFPVPKADPINDPHEKRIREFVENVFKGVVKLPEKGTICVTKWRYATVALVWKTREELEHWNLRYHIDSIDNEDLGAQLTAMMEGLTSESLEDLQNGASDEQAEFDITFVQ